MSLPITYPRFKAFVPGTNAPLVGGTVEFYVSGTTTPLAVYADAAQTVSIGTIVTLDANGEATIFPNTAALYKMILKDSLGNQLWTFDGWSQGGATQISSNHNFLMNGAFDEWQAGTSFVGANSLFLADGWAANLGTISGGGVVTDYTISKQLANAVAPLPGFNNCIRIQRNVGSTASRTTVLIQNCESVDSLAFQSQFATLSFYVRASATMNGWGTLTGNIISGGGIDESYQTALTLTSVANNQTITGFSLNNWLRVSMSTQIPLAATINQMVVSLTLSGVSLTTAGANDYVDFTGFQLEIGQAPTPFERETFDTMRRRAQRRYYKTFPDLVSPAQNAGLPGAIAIPQTVGAAAAMSAQLWLPSWMRDSGNNVPGTITTYNPSAANANARNTTVAADCGAPTLLSEAGNNLVISTMNSAGGSAAGNNNRLHYTVDRRF